MASPAFDDFQKIVDFFNTASSLVGQSITNESWYKYPKSIYRWACAIVIISSAVGAPPFITENIGDLTKIAECNVHTAIVLQVGTKILYYTIFRKKMTNIIQLIKKFRLTHIQTDKEFEICKLWTVKSRFVSRLFFFCYLGTMVPAIIRGWLTHGLPYALQLPYISHDFSPGYEINFIFQVVTFFMGISMTCMIDGLLAVALQEACLQFDVIQEKLSFLGSKCNKGSYTEKEQLKDLHDLHVMHLESNEYLYFINAAFSVMLFSQFASSTFVITNLLINVSTANEYNFGMYSLIISFSCQIFSLCWFGEQARTRMNSMLYAMYDNHWYELAPSARKALMIMMVCCQKEYSVSAGGLINLTLATYVAIMRSAYSYYAVMKDSNK